MTSQKEIFEQRVAKMKENGLRDMHVSLNIEEIRRQDPSVSSEMVYRELNAMMDADEQGLSVPLVGI